MYEKIICHYTKRETALEKILVTKQLLLGQLGKTNDPRETKDWNIPFPYTFGLLGREKEKEQELVSVAISEVKEDYERRMESGMLHIRTYEYQPN